MSLLKKLEKTLTRKEIETRIWIKNDGSIPETSELVLVRYLDGSYNADRVSYFKWSYLTESYGINWNCLIGLYAIKSYTILEAGWYNIRDCGTLSKGDIHSVVYQDVGEIEVTDSIHIKWQEVLAYKLKKDAEMTVEEQQNENIETYNDHYDNGGLDVAGKFDIILDKLGDSISTKESAYLFNVLKYFDRAGTKEGESLDKDLTKCANYMCRLTTGKFLNELKKEIK